MLTTPTYIQRSGCAAVIVMQTTGHRKRDDSSCLRSLPLGRHGNTLVNSLMRPRAIEEVRVLPHHLMQMAFVEDENVVEALTM